MVFKSPVTPIAHLPNKTNVAVVETGIPKAEYEFSNTVPTI